MSRVLRIGGAQMGPIHKADSRQAVVRRMLDLLDQAKAQNCDLVVYPELALTTFFPRWYMTDQAEVDAWFEREMPNAATRPLFEQAADYRIGFSFGYAELTPTAITSTPRFWSIATDDRRQVSQGASARPFRVRSAARLPAPGEALFRARRSRLPGLAHDGRHRRHVHLQRPALARDLSGHGTARRGADRARLQHAVGQFAESRRRGRRNACSTTA